MIRVELGCGTTKNDGYIGIDRFPLPNVDIVADLDKGIPLDSDSVDIIFCSHSLEHFKDLNNIISEIYRVCKHKAIVNILAPYHMESVNLANFYHKNVFNESTFRFFTDEEKTHLDTRDYYNPHASLWGLASSDNSNNTINLVTLSMEYFYFPGYESLSDDEKRNARKSLINVCDQIYYSLAVNKSQKAFTEDEIGELQSLAKAEEIPTIDIIRKRILDDKLGFSIINDIKKWDDIILLKQELAEKRLITRIDENSMDIHTVEQRLIGQLKQSEQLLSETVNQSEQALTKKLNLSNKNFEDIIARMNIDNNELMSQLEKKYMDRIEAITSEKNSLAAVILDLVKANENTSFISRHFSFFRRNRDFYGVLSLNYKKFMDGLILQNKDFTSKAILTLSNTIPFSGYFEYKINGYGNKINFYIFSNIGAKLFLEVVVHGRIVKQESHTITYEGVYTTILEEPINGEAFIRFRALDNLSIIRTLEITNRKWIVFSRQKLAAFINQ